MSRAVENPFDDTIRPFAEPLPLELFDAIQPSLDVRDFVQGVLVEGSAAVVYGESNSGKTFWATDLCLHVAAGMAWNGRRIEQRGVIYCVLEGGQSFRNRIAAWREHHCPSGSVHFAAVAAQVNLLDIDADSDALIRTIKLAAQRMGTPVGLVVIDTLSRAMAGGNENGPEDMGQLVANMDRIRKETGATILFIHHSGKDQARGMRGHSLLLAAIDTEIEVKELEDGLRTATVVKQRDLSKGDEFTFRLDVLTIGKNRYDESVTTCIVRTDGDAAQKPEERRNPVPPSQRRAFEVLADLCACQGDASAPGTPTGSISVAESVWRDHFYDRAMPGAEAAAKRRGFRRAADMLISSKHVGMALGRVWLAAKPEGGDPVPPPSDDEIPD